MWSWKYSHFPHTHNLHFTKLSRHGKLHAPSEKKFGHAIIAHSRELKWRVRHTPISNTPVLPRNRPPRSRPGNYPSTAESLCLAIAHPFFPNRSQLASARSAQVLIVLPLWTSRGPPFFSPAMCFTYLHAREFRGLKRENDFGDFRSGFWRGGCFRARGPLGGFRADVYCRAYTCRGAFFFWKMYISLGPACAECEITPGLTGFGCLQLWAGGFHRIHGIRDTCRCLFFCRVRGILK